MRRIGVLYNPLSESSIRISHELTGWLHGRGLSVWRGVSHEGREEPSALDDLELLVALGGDGTVLRAAHLAIAKGGNIPVLPVALGHLSFMSELQPEELYEGIATLLDGGGWHDERSLIAATIMCDERPPQHVLALNEVIVGRGDINRVVHVDVEIYNTSLTTYVADGVIVASATGSTAYALSAGGPVVDPRSRALTLVPLAAHLTNIPSLVLHEDATISLHVRSRHPALFASDGRATIALHAGDTVEVRRTDQTMTFARVHPPSAFYAGLAKRLRREP
ncbi:MAG: NAD(+)/NADH kinase [Roseiflexaceae bacterium]|nr:NAD(+)/NADH kinase [Roseiflexaceae bacterium]